MNGIEVFSRDGLGKIRVSVNSDGIPYFVAKDACDIVGLSNVTVALSRLDEDEFISIKLIDSIGREQNAYAVSEAGLYSLILGSRKPEAKTFKRWVTHEILPSIRKHGGYLTPEKVEEALLNPDTIIRLATDLKTEREMRKTLEARNAVLAPKAQFADSVLSADGTYSITEASRLLKQADPKMGQKKLFERLKADELITKQGNQATAKAIERGYLYNHKPDNRENPVTGEVKTFDPYARVTNKGLRWMVEHYCNPQAQLELEVL
ncbi:phage antirepressor [Adlercreutzia caecimuris]|jgi:anti-repressor protein|uniref:phage antirepressor n=1 Tax=Adlercreutzia caecimuris TaxID=671266 RepID=UPI001C3E189A|nr:phage antirepressor [Adlercreutzia caecimuris]